MRSILVLCLISSLLLACVNASVMHVTDTVLQRRLEKITNDSHKNATLEKGSTTSKKSKKSKNLEKSEQEIKGLRGMRCDNTLYTQSNLKDASKQACNHITNKTRTWGFVRFPLAYQPSSEEIKYPLSSGEEKKADIQFLLYPILHSGNVYKRFGISLSPSHFSHELTTMFFSGIIGRTGPHRIIVTRECKVVGAVVKTKSIDNCQGIKCWNPFRYKHPVYKTCELDYYR
ncbi:putative csep0475 effector protein [Erysiphe neolycopersici]|uniref:Putative csep0475 effector protein n=1 Tax=Erysiphe neolycopersici TaxID=212602 RepID=A0A420HBA8_9PEZI|nr:putative csep0475 effector protein [Erysiphe neolycopersici]